MRLGCGCFLVVIVVIAVVGGLAWATANVLGEPDLRRVSVTAADSQRAQEKIYAIAARTARRGTEVPLTETEVNAFVSRNLSGGTDLGISDLRVELGPTTARLAARTTLGALLTEPPLSGLRQTLPGAWLGHPVWLAVILEPRVEATTARRRWLRLDVREFRLGRQRVPAFLVRIVLDPETARVLRWSLPDNVESVRIETGRAVVRIAS